MADVRTAELIERLDNPHPWSLATHPDPSRKHWSFIDGRGTMISMGDPDQAPLIPEYQPSQELLIEAEDEETAENVAALIYGGVLLGYPDHWRNPPPPGPAAVSALASHDLSRDNFFRGRFHYYENLLVGCRTAIEAWGSSELTYGVEKYKLSLELDSFTPHSASPRYGQVFSTSNLDYSYHVRAAFALVTAFSVIEELGVEVRSGQQKPRFIGENKDVWNPEVWDDLNRRMTARGLSAEEEFYWLVRGDPTAVEKEIAPQLGAEVDGWNEEVRDRRMRLGDAVHQVSLLRNFIAAHKFRDVVAELGPYDVHNSQRVARRALLGSLGLWKWLLAYIRDFPADD